MALTFLDLYNECAGQPWSMFDNDAESVEDFESAMKISINSENADGWKPVSEQKKPTSAKHWKAYSVSAKHFQEKALSYLWNLKFWSFRKYTQKIKTRIGREHYQKPNGIIEKKAIAGVTRYSIKYGKKFLDYENDYEILEDKTGEPEVFYLKGDNILFYPTPDSDYTINIDYFLLPYGLNNAEEQIYELKEDNDYINIPEKYETLFKNCLISLSMIFLLNR